MTGKTLGKQQLADLKEICEETGIKLTHQRLEIFKKIMSAYDHPSAEVIHRRLREKLPTIAIDTVYRTLATFDELGIVKKLQVMGEGALFDANLDRHHHFVCTRCKGVEDIYWPEFDNSLLPEKAGRMGQVQSRHLELRGICNRCLKEAEQSSCTA